MAGCAAAGGAMVAESPDGGCIMLAGSADGGGIMLAWCGAVGGSMEGMEAWCASGCGTMPMPLPQGRGIGACSITVGPPTAAP